LGKPAFSASVVIPGGEVFIPLEGILDKEKEIARLKKEIEKAESFAASIEKKLSNESFVKNAPAAVIDSERQKFATQRDIVEKSRGRWGRWGRKFVYYLSGDLRMLATVQEKAVTSSGNVTQRAYTTEEVFERIDQKLIKAFGEGFEDRLNQEKAKRGLQKSFSIMNNI
jgi:hypothetical protein